MNIELTQKEVDTIIRSLRLMSNRQHQKARNRARQIKRLKQEYAAERIYEGVPEYIYKNGEAAPSQSIILKERIGLLHSEAIPRHEQKAGMVSLLADRLERTLLAE